MNVSQIAKLVSSMGLLIAFSILLLAPRLAFAAEGGLMLRYQQHDATFSVYRVADIAPSGVYEKADAFATCPVDLSGENFREVALQLASYVAQGDVAADAVCEADGGVATFLGLDGGLYLVMGTDVEQNDVRYTPVPFLVEVVSDRSMEALVKCDESSLDAPDVPNAPANPGMLGEPGPSDSPGSSDEARLPQTGDLQLPMFAAACSGVALCAAGVIVVATYKMRRKDG